MKQRLRNIGSVAKYESKLLTRSWFFKIFIIILALIAAIMLMAVGQEQNNLIHTLGALPTIVPYIIILYLNIAQSFVIIFLSADYLKRDKQLDTSEVFYVRPLSNAEYLLGKMWGTIKPFLQFNGIFLLILFFIVRFILNINCQIGDFITYYFIVVVPSLIFITGASTALMLTIGNQAITFIIMLGASVLSLMYSGGYVGNLFDIFLYELPITKSAIIGITNLSTILNHRAIYAVIGVASILLSISLFKRLASSKKSKYYWFIASIATYCLAIVLIFNYYLESTKYSRVSKQVIALNSKYADYPKLQVDNYTLDITQHPYSLSTIAKVSGTVAGGDVEKIVKGENNKLVFTLNSGMNITSVTTEDSTSLNFIREGHIVVVELDEPKDSLTLIFKYSGAISENELYVDIKKEFRDVYNKFLNAFKLDKKGAFITPNWVVLTPESNWYIKPGVTYSDEVTNWRSDYFSNYSVNITPLKGQIPVTQGVPTLLADSLSYNYTTQEPLRAISLAISDYKVLTTKVDSIDYSLYIHSTNINKISILDSIRDTIPALIKEMKGDFERFANTEYSLKRFTIVDAPEQLFSYVRDWSTTQEIAQPEMLFLPGFGCNFKDDYNLNSKYQSLKRASDRGWLRPPMSDKAIKATILTNHTYLWGNKSVTDNWQSSAGGNFNVVKKPNPHYLPSVLFNGKYNIISDSLSWGNQLIEIYYSSYDNLLKENANKRNNNGMSDIEQMLILLQEKGANSFLSSAKYSRFSSEIIMTQINTLFAEAMSKMGYENFDNYFRELIEQSEYKNITLNTILDSLSAHSGCNLRTKLKELNKPLELPAFYFRDVETESSYLNDEPIFSTEVVVSNISNVTGYVELIYSIRDDIEKAVIELAPNETKRVVKHHSTAIPRVNANTMNSKNIPQYTYLKVNRPESERRRGRGGRGGSGKNRVTKPLKPEGEFILKGNKITPEGEVIVDNEDSKLFSISAPPKSGYLNSWIDKSMSSEYKYMSPHRRAPYKWGLISNEQFYGTYIRSGLMIRGSKTSGNQSVTWKIPVENGSKYSLYFSTKAPDELRSRQHYRGRGRNVELTYDFTIDAGKEEEETTYNFKNMSFDVIRSYSFSWEWIGDYTAESDTISISLSNKSNMYKVNADAVKAVKIK